MKIYKWIDKLNQNNNRKIISKYNHGVISGKSAYFYLNPKFYPKYLLRLLLVLASAITFHKKAYKAFYTLVFKKYSPIYPSKGLNIAHNKLFDICGTLFGYRYFIPETILPLLPEEKILKKQIKFIANDIPRISIVIPVFNNLSYTYNCLLSLSNNAPSSLSYEVIIVDDCSSDGTEKFFKSNSSGIKYIRNKANSGFLISSNNGARQAKGEYVCFLNNDTQVNINWLENLLIPFNDEQIGVVGSKLIYANGFLQEAGGLVFSDANAANYGNNQDPTHPSYNFIREVDYCSGASILIRNVDLQKLDYFDLRYIPAYYEDTDLCLSVKHILDKKVIYQPLSQLIHFEGISSGRDIEKHPIKRFQVVNKEKFAQKWHNQLPNYPYQNSILSSLTKHKKNKTILIIDDTIPEPDKDSGSVRLVHIIKILISLKHHIVFVPNDGLKKNMYFEQLTNMGVEILYRFPNRKSMIKLLLNKLDTIDVAWICKPQNNKEFEFLFNHNPKIKWIYDTIDLHFLREEREAELLNNTELKQSANKTKEQELAFAKAADITIAITNDEKELLENYGIAKTTVIPNIHISQENNNAIPFEERSGIIFIGGYAHKPNIDAVKYLSREIMPLVWAKNPTIKLTLLGSNPNNEVMELASEKIHVTGYLEDVSDYFNNSRVFAAPLRFGAGMKGKIGQSLSYALPVVTSSIGAEGIGLISEQDYLLAATANEFANQILKLYENRALWERISNNAKKLIKSYHPDHIRPIIDSILS
ncbi:Glycosyltransferase, GT2 family [Pedobacter terrae]|uniref:Glycosyltransferase, GT2 family n=1 Tax=Pedobacter terrae TaxID=405671 RepID=A0A1G8BHU0_9SPHI|nr:glycosyltransferase [Pedobacter terrae]SDH32805.1 Glycosyltransferase, GT2 family [Pedobacter terrae]